MNLRVFIFFSLLLLPIFLVAPARALATDDAVQFGSDINASPDHPIHDAVCFFCSVHAEGEVTGDIVVFFGDVHLNGTAHGDVVNFFGRTRLGDNAIVDGDLVKFFGSVRAGKNAQAAKDLIIIFGSLRAPGSFSVGKDRFVMPGWVLWIPFIIFASIVIAIVRAFRAWQWRRNMYTGFPAPHA